ncbi:protein tfg-1 isoform X2 [Bactrocera dorsalis]|uniref:Protein tfg-1 isoform X2 n=1 Tax=Bactrocera dorsalis TaxID=27457 RepID=A0ABM3J4S2_BACDO|nr:protein tfg-1 isoform X2 [Bactrocera dorsalis]
MSWRLGCFVLTALAVWQAHAKPLIEDATFSDVDLVAEDSHADAVYVAAPARSKRTPQHFGGNCGFNGCGGRNIFGSNNSPAFNSYAYVPYNNAVQPPATVVNHVHQRDGPPPPIVQPQQQYHPTQTTAVVVSHQHQASTGTVVRHEHQRNGPPPPSTPISGFHNHPPPGFHGGNPFGPPYGGPPGHGPPGHGPPGHGPPGHYRPPPPDRFGPPGHYGPPGDFGPPDRDYEGPPDFDNSPTPPVPSVEPWPSQETSPAIPQPEETPPPSAPTQPVIAPVPSTTPAPVLVTVAPTTSTTTTTTTAEPFYDIDVRFGN